MTKRYGLVFKVEDQCWLSEYVNGTIEDASPLNDEKGAYTELNPREMVIVEIVHENDIDSGELVSIMDMRTVTIRCDNNPKKTVTDLVASGSLPELAETIFENEDFFD